MSIEKYTTEAFVLESYDQGENDRAFKLFTKEFGLITAVAKGIRKMESKLRFQMLVGSHVKVTLVQGKEVWRITGSFDRESVLPSRRVVLQLILRFVRGQLAQQTLFEHVRELTKLSPSEVGGSFFHLLSYYMVLVDLGYADATKSGAKKAEEYLGWSIQDHIVQLRLSEKYVRDHVHTVLKEIQL